MYNQYADGSFLPLDEVKSSETARPQARKSTSQRTNSPLGELTGGLSHLLGGMFKQFSADQFDTGDILLVLIILFLFLEGDNLELVITLGLMLLFGLNDD